ncbi:hypothetical protein F0562_017565 [Nyssa sinensis]|uniref:cysteine dioxygenase n=1 Tax=Nyssa sinensis TaxID=561372 RepID=A0A5J4ZIE4_9ASTE|nr:hypothetical protein F0562_017565 [Nyssa sinensis]
MRNIVQKLFETCKEVFAIGEAGCVPPPADIERLRLVLDSVKLEDVNLTPSMPYFNRVENEDAPPITYLHIYECNKFLIGIFCLPPSGVIPLYNHPGMTVFSKLLFGTKHIKSYDWVTEIPSSMDENGNLLRDLAGQRPGTRLAKVHIDSDCTAPCKTSILSPATGGNMHCFRALTACAVLDVFGPLYSDSKGMHCAYYHDFPCTIFSVILSSSISKLNGSEMKSLIRYLGKWLKKYERFPQAGPCPKASSTLSLKACVWVPTLVDIVKCLGLVLDEHFSSLVLHPEFHEELRSVVGVVNSLALEARIYCSIANVIENLRTEVKGA